MKIEGIKPGTTEQELGKLEDAAHNNSATGVLVMAVRADTAATTVDTDGDYHPILVDANGKLWVAASLGAGTSTIGKLGANSGVDIGDVTLNAGTATIGKLGANSGVDIGDVDVTSIAAGSNTIGNTRDAGPAQTLTRTYTASADMTTAADISPAPSSGEKIVASDILVSTDTAMGFSIQEETSATVFAKVYLPANGTAQITLRGCIKAAVANKKLQGKASAAGNVAVTCITYSEA